MRHPFSILSLLFLLASVAGLGACRGGSVGHETIARCVPEGACDEAMFETGLHSLPANLSVGASLFETGCASCHGKGGQGMEATRRVNFTDPIWHVGKKDRDIASAITQGRPPLMPPMPMAEGQLRDLVGYLRSLRRGEAPKPAPAQEPGY
jgi:hypothetical protein